MMKKLYKQSKANLNTVYAYSITCNACYGSAACPDACGGDSHQATLSMIRYLYETNRDKYK